MRTIGSSSRQNARPAAVRGSRAPIAYAGNPGWGVGRTCGTSVAHGRPSISAASAAATVRMSATTTSGSNDRIAGSVSRAPCTAAWYGFTALPALGNTSYSGAGANRIPSRSTCSRHLTHVSRHTSCPRRTSSRPSAIAGNACPASPNAASMTRRRGPPAIPPGALRPARPAAGSCRSARRPSGPRSSRGPSPHPCRGTSQAARAPARLARPGTPSR